MVYPKRSTPLSPIPWLRPKAFYALFFLGSLCGNVGDYIGSHKCHISATWRSIVLITYLVTVVIT